MFQISADQMQEIISILSNLPAGQAVPSNTGKPVAFLYCELLKILFTEEVQTEKKADNE